LLTDNNVLQIFVQRGKDTVTKLDLGGCKKLTDSLLFDVARYYCIHLDYLGLDEMDQISENAIGAVLKSALHLKSLSLSDCRKYINDKSLLNFAPYCKQLKYLNLSNLNQVTDVGIQNIMATNTNLTQLCLSNCNSITEISIKELSSRNPKLEIFDIRNCWRIDNKAISFLTQICQNITTLILAECNKLSDAAIIEIAKTYKNNLVKLDISGCLRITDAAIVEIAENCKNMANLGLQRCYNLTTKSIVLINDNCPKVTELDVTKTKITHEDVQKLAALHIKVIYTVISISEDFKSPRSRNYT